MCNVDVFRAKFFVQALAQASQSKFRDGKDAGERVAPQRSSGAGEDQRSSLARPFVRMLGRIGQFVFSESRYRGSRERKGADHARGRGTFDVFIGNVEKLFKSAFPSIIDRYANLRGGKMRVNGREYGLDIRGSVALDWERLSLRRIPDSGAGQPTGKNVRTLIHRYVLPRQQR